MACICYHFLSSNALSRMSVCLPEENCTWKAKFFLQYILKMIHIKAIYTLFIAVKPTSYIHLAQTVTYVREELYLKWDNVVYKFQFKVKLRERKRKLMNANRCKQHFVKIPILLTRPDVDVCRYKCKAIANWGKNYIKWNTCV